MPKIASTIFAAAIVLPLSAPATAADAFKPSIEEQVKLGQKAAAEDRKKYKILPDTDYRVKLIRRIGQSLVASMPAKERNKPFVYSFDVIESKEVNAYAYPGGATFFYTGLLDKLKNEDEVAGVIGHEITHALQEHWARGYSDGLKKQLGIGALLGILGANDTLYDVSGIVLGLDSLKYSRKNELAADGNGYSLVVGSGYNPQGMVNVFTMFQEMKGKKGSGFETYLSTHPDDKTRIDRLNAQIKKAKQPFPAMRPLPKG